MSTSLAAQRQFSALSSPLDSPAFNTTGSAYGDLDGDGDLDLIVTSNPNVLKFENDGLGNFFGSPAGGGLGISFNPSCCELGDLDGDGDLDLVVGTLGTQVNRDYNRLFLNDGTGEFSEPSGSYLPRFVRLTNALELGDVDGDGDLDLVVGDSANSSSEFRRTGLFLNDGMGRFTAVLQTNTPNQNNRTEDLALADLDGDGDLDIVLANTRDLAVPQRNRIYRNDGTGVFHDDTPNNLPGTNDPSTSVAAADVDGDGDIDLAFGNTTSSGPVSLTQNRLFLNDGTGSFTDVTATRMPTDQDPTESVEFLDVDGDGDPDLVLTSSPNSSGTTNRLYLNDGSGSFTDATPGRLPTESNRTTSLAGADFDQDGDTDLITGVFGGPNRFLRNDGSGVFREVVPFRDPGVPGNGSTDAIALVDVDADGDLDVLRDMLGSAGELELLINDGFGGFGAPIAIGSTIGAVSSVTAGDIDGDSDLDLFVTTPSGRANLLFTNDGTGNFVDSTIAAFGTPSTSTAYDSAAVDVDGDGDLDLIIASESQNELHLNDGSGSFTNATTSRMPAFAQISTSVVTGDFDGDGDADIVIGNRFPGRSFYYGDATNRILLNDGSGFFNQIPPRGLPGFQVATMALETADLDGDGDLDLAGATDFSCGFGPGSCGGGAPEIYLNNGDATFLRRGSALDAISVSTDLVLGDIDDDGDIDLVFASQSGFTYPAPPDPSIQNTTFFNDGQANFTAQSDRLPTKMDGAKVLALGDLDGDRDLDLIFGNEGQDRVYRNLLHQVILPHRVEVGQPFAIQTFARSGPVRASDTVYGFLSPTRLPMPLNLGSIGPIGIDLGLAIPLPPTVAVQPDGFAGQSIQVPNNPSLSGLPLHLQSILVRSPLEPALTNVVSVTIQ